MEENNKVRKFLAWLLHALRKASPHLVLLACYVGYLAIGGLLFKEIETNANGQDIKTYNEKLKGKNDAIKQFWNKTMAERENMHEASQEEYQNFINDMNTNLTRHLEDLEEAVGRPEWKMGRIHSVKARRTWTFSSSMLFCMTTITTIGYGDMVPTSTKGRVFCVAYSIVGIPFTLLCLADIGHLLSRCIVKLCRLLRIKTCKHDFSSLRNSFRNPSAGSNGNTISKDRTTGERTNQVSDNFELKVDVTTTENEKEENKPYTTNRGYIDKNEFRKSYGLGIGLRDLENDNGSSIEAETNVVLAGEKCPNEKIVQDHMFDHKRHIFLEHENECQEEVPILIVILILILYILFGALIIHKREQWSFGEGVYFTFITITTIGYGDYVTANHYRDNSFIFCIVFTIVGMAVMSMTIALMQAKVIRLLTFISNKLNLH